MVVLGLLFAVFGFIFLILVGCFSGYVGIKFQKNSNVARYMQYISGIVMIILGLCLAFLKR